MRKILSFIQNLLLLLVYLAVCYYSVAVMVRLVNHGKDIASLMALIFVYIFWSLSLIVLGIFIYTILNTKQK
jgi:TRAP-type C4-dicarboxylate transport system permease small subunit